MVYATVKKIGDVSYSYCSCM